MTRKSTRRSAAAVGDLGPVGLGTVGEARAAGAAPGPTASGTMLPAMLRALDLDTLRILFRGFHMHFAGARLACKALREAFDNSKKSVHISVTNLLAHIWQPYRRSPLALAPNCSFLHLDINTEESDDEEEREEWEDDTYPRTQLPSGVGCYPHEHLARLALIGTSAEGRGRVRRLQLTFSGAELELSGVVAALVSQLPGLEEIDARGCELLAGMNQADFTRPAVLHQTLASAAPRLRRLHLTAAGGMLHSLGALAACSSLERLSIYGQGCGGEPPELNAQAVADLSSLRRLTKLRLRCHDASGGGHLAALLGGRRPPGLRSLKIKASLHALPAGRRGRAALDDDLDSSRQQHLPFAKICFEAGEAGGPGSIQSVEARPHVYPQGGAKALDLFAMLLVTATEQLPPRCRRIGQLTLEAFDVAKWAASPEQLQQSLGPEGPVAALLVRCDGVRLGTLQVAEGGSAAACSVLRALGMPRKLGLRHGCLDLEAPPAAHSPATAAAGAAAAATAAAVAAAPPPPPSTRPEPQPGVAAWLHSPLRLESATPDAVLREAMERLWRAAAEPPPAAAAAAAGRDSLGDDLDWLLLDSASCSKFVLLRGGPQLPPAGDGDGGAAYKAVARWLDQLAGLVSAEDAGATEAEAEASGLGPHLRFRGTHVSAPCANTFVCLCSSGADAEALVAALPPPATAASAADTAAGAAAGVAAPAPIAVNLPRHLPATSDYHDGPGVVKSAVLQVLSDLWHQPPTDEARGRRRSSASGAAAAVGGPGTARLGGAAVGRIRQVLDLDLAVTRQWRAVRTEPKPLLFRGMYNEASEGEEDEE
ncbi:hypothetical protein HYH02_004996 [Chlamydomonas schloesseri]|uniref:Uncharacterized protein n=1 Tax=Chlamydomonas schloesseri TaxID=2026947 RepID=A0A835WPS7_9CHLO|nr:hypothetical protein HYH02_004996 [Chlamydomonas schloesseri]|eukprot:KAG2450495.1 hypothetical protein HYH02_004996 [Chlamydomonas schloesseri]